MIPLEDNVGDIIGKAQRGLGISDSELAEKARVNSQTIRKLRDGDFDETAILSVAPILELNGSALCELARGEWHPIKIEAIDGLEQLNTDYHGMAVNADLVDLILLTHAHPDHVADLPGLREETGAEVFGPEREPVPGAEPIEEGKRFRLGRLQIDTRLTWGHSPGGITYVVTGLSRPIAIVGDSLFAGSMGGGNVSYQDALRNNLEKILTLSDDTIICPGHGPMTTVGEEKAHNPFFAGKV